MDSIKFPEFTRQFVAIPVQKEIFNGEGTAVKSGTMLRKRDESADPGDSSTTSSKSDETEPPHKKPKTSTRILVCCFSMKSQ